MDGQEGSPKEANQNYRTSRLLVEHLEGQKRLYLSEYPAELRISDSETQTAGERVGSPTCPLAVLDPLSFFFFIHLFFFLSAFCSLGAVLLHTCSLIYQSNE